MTISSWCLLQKTIRTKSFWCRNIWPELADKKTSRQFVTQLNLKTIYFVTITPIKKKLIICVGTHVMKKNMLAKNPKGIRSYYNVMCSTTSNELVALLLTHKISQVNNSFRNAHKYSYFIYPPSAKIQT